MAIDNLTRLIGKTNDAKVAADLVAERAQMRGELSTLRETQARDEGRLVDLASRRRGGRS